MKFFVCNEDTNNKKILLEKSMWTGKTSLYIDGKQLKKLGKNNFVYRNEEHEVEFRLKGNEISGIELITNGRTITLLRKLNLFEIFLTLIPIALVIIGGAIGGALAGIGMVSIATFCRKINNFFYKILFSLGVYVTITVVWFILASLFFEVVL